jgi:phage shock protein A
MGIFDRIADLLNANVNDALDKAENPEKMLKQIIREIEESIDTSKTETAKILAEAKRLEKEVDAKAKEVDTWQTRAEGAVDGGDDDLARQALERKNSHKGELEAMTSQLDDTQAAVEQMKNNTVLLQKKLTETRARYTALTARASAAKASQDVQEKVAKVSAPGQALDKLDKLERRIEDMESEASVMASTNAANDELADTFEKKEGDLAIDTELAALKAKRQS